MYVLVCLTGRVVPPMRRTMAGATLWDGEETNLFSERYFPKNLTATIRKVFQFMKFKFNFGTYERRQMAQ
jgi:hypothetical protein